jgi:putative SOS response-associated peptidase YedK
MCGRVVIHTPMGTLFDSVAGHALQASARPARFTVAPRSTLSIVTDNDERRVRDTAAWGFIPVWSTDPSRAPQPINARAATVATSRLFKRAFEQRRCLLPVDGFYEWQTRAGARKQPYCMHRSDGEPLALAGLWELWSGHRRRWARWRAIEQCYDRPHHQLCAKSLGVGTRSAVRYDAQWVIRSQSTSRSIP